MCSGKFFRMPTLAICGVVLTIILVCITGITLTNSINISNIVKLREKVASDSAAANGGHQAAQTRAALVEQQYSTLQQHHLSQSDLNYISASTHPKNLQRPLQQQQQQLPQQQPNKIVIEIGLRSANESANASKGGGKAASGSGSGRGSGSGKMPLGMPHMLEAAEALMEGNVDSISLPAAVPLVASAPTTEKSSNGNGNGNTNKRSSGNSPERSSSSTGKSIDTEHSNGRRRSIGGFNGNNTENSLKSRTRGGNVVVMDIRDHNPGGIQFERRAHVKQTMKEPLLVASLIADSQQHAHR